MANSQGLHLDITAWTHIVKLVGVCSVFPPVDTGGTIICATALTVKLCRSVRVVFAGFCFVLHNFHSNEESGEKCRFWMDIK